MIHTLQNIGIDKISLHTFDFQVINAQKSGLRIKPHEINLETGEQESEDLFLDASGTQFKGQRAYFNEDDLYQLDISNRGMRITFNPSKYLHPYNLTDDPRGAWSEIENNLKNRGITGAWSEANVTRLDLAKNVTLKQPCLSYNPVWDLLNVKRTKNPSTYPDGYATHNNSTGVNFYNKGKEAKETKLGNNTMRGELQWKKKASVRSNSGIYTMNNLLEVGSTDLEKAYSMKMSNDVFRSDDVNGQQIIPFNDTYVLFQQLVKESRRSAVNKLKAIISTQYIIQDLGGMEAFKLMLKQEGYSRSVINDHIKQASKELMQGSRLRSSCSVVGTLYRELHQKFAS